MSRQCPESVERSFFAALMETNHEALDQLLAEDFLLIDGMTGSEAPKSAWLETTKARQLRFDEITLKECWVRQYGPTAVITGRTEMKGTFSGEPFQASSRYTHVFVEQGEDWRLVSAQGTKLVPTPETP